MQIILASKSPRRRELLSLLGLGDFRVLPSAAEPEPKEELPPGQALEEVALAKALDVQERFGGPEDIVIGADTMVCLDGWLLGKPESPGQAREMLTALSGRRHTVYTGLALLKGTQRVTGHEATEVYFRRLNEEEKCAYLDRENVLDKAGAYAVQGLAAAFVERIEGDYFNVVGLPLCRLTLLLRQLGLDIFGDDR